MPASYVPPELRGKVALVAGASRGAGRGIAVALGEAGATVYCTGRSSRLVRRTPRKVGAGGDSSFDLSNRLETIEETAERVTVRGGIGIPVVVDHASPSAVQKLLAQIEQEQGRLDILVNAIWGGDPLLEFGKAFWQLDLQKGFRMIENGVHTHIVTSRFAVPLLIESAKESSGGLIVEVTDGDSYQYRGNLFYDLAKTTAIRMAFAFARELRRKNVAAVALTPGFLRSEVMLEHLGVTEVNWREAVAKDSDFAESETPVYSGRAVANLAADPNLAEKSGRVFSTWTLAEEYDFCDVDGRQPHWGKHMQKKCGDAMRPCDNAFYEYWAGGMTDTLLANWP
jgi:NAD(P)-dependent dehydrogenase (short-subunit alcohol dehydrogenase family)